MKSKTCSCPQCKTHCHCAIYADFFAALSNANRIHIINALKKGKRSVSQIQEETQLEQSSISHNLKALQKAGFVESEVKGKYRIYEIKKDIKTLMDIIDKHVGVKK